MRVKLSYLLRTILTSCGAFALLATGARPAAAISWSNPHHAYVVLVDPVAFTSYVQEVSVDPKPGPALTLRGTNTGFSRIDGLAIGPQGNLYVSGCFGPDYRSCTESIRIFAAGANGNVAPIATLWGKHTKLTGPNGLAFDSSGRLYVAQQKSVSGGKRGEIDVFAAGATGDVAPIAVIDGPNTQFRGQELAYVAVDNAGEIFAGGTRNNWIGKFAAGAKGNVAPLAVAQVQPSLTNALHELQVSGNTVFAAVGEFRDQSPTVHELSTTDLSQNGGLTNKRFTVLHADADAAGKVYVENIIRTNSGGFIGFLYEYPPGSQTPARIRNLGRTYIGCCVVAGP